MFSVALSLALAAFAPILPASSVASGAAIAVCFVPEEDCSGFAVCAIDNAEREILVGAYGLTTGSGIVEALVRAKERGVDVRLIADKTTPCEREGGIEPLAAAGVPIWIDAQARIAHAKTMVIDGAITLTGSMNWTRGAAVNSEDLNLVSSATVAAAYAAHWRERLTSRSGSTAARTGAGRRLRRPTDAPEPTLFPTPTSAEAVQGHDPRPGGLRRPHPTIRSRTPRPAARRTHSNAARMANC